MSYKIIVTLISIFNKPIRLILSGGSRTSLQANDEQTQMPQTPIRMNKTTKEKDARLETRGEQKTVNSS